MIELVIQGVFRQEYRFGFNGKEKDTEWTGQQGSHLDFGARIYDSRIGRWTALDPKMIEMPYSSPYCYSFNNPILFVDPDGEKPQVTVNKSEDGKTIDINITNKFYIIKKSQDISNVDETALNKYLTGGSYEVDGVTYNVNITNEVIYKDKKSGARKAIKSDNMVGVIVDLGAARKNDDIGNNSYHTQGRFDRIHMEDYKDLERVLAHEGGHDMGFADKYINTNDGTYIMLNFINALMGGHEQLSGYEIQLIGSDVMNQVGNLENGQTKALPKGSYAVDTEADMAPYGETVSGVPFEDTNKDPKDIKVTTSGGTPDGKIEKD
ncbi:MAG: hypothetical protein PF448_05050 [Bacteroidales bacterium]|nr:hypothetical protein [Bacteroidales bacterium]